VGRLRKDRPIERFEKKYKGSGSTTSGVRVDSTTAFLGAAAMPIAFIGGERLPADDGRRPSFYGWWAINVFTNTDPGFLAGKHEGGQEGSTLKRSTLETASRRISGLVKAEGFARTTEGAPTDPYLSGTQVGA